ncbi:hypothetical protein AGOR_G00099490 [Albula goreensis]|uniref:Uncharacterized protein n=1 Tax=Albula goreensis TaxID=1534307 RepID=A0A8T3DNF0_9TELE|nr:hypothetical protein AGOR_G00099490 [Albula goreensis]
MRLRRNSAGMLPPAVDGPAHHHPERTMALQGCLDSGKGLQGIVRCGGSYIQAFKRTMTVSPTKLVDVLNNHLASFERRATGTLPLPL